MLDADKHHPAKIKSISINFIAETKAASIGDKEFAITVDLPLDDTWRQWLEREIINGGGKWNTR